MTSERGIGRTTSAWLAISGLVVLAVSVGLWRYEAGAAGSVRSMVEQHSSRASAIVYHFWWLLSDLGHGLVITSVLAMVALLRGPRRLFQDALLNSVAVGIGAAIVKVCVDRARPYAGGLSWPSGHAAAILALALACVTKPRLLLVALPLAGLVGVARVMHFRHWPSDILGGYGIALCISAVVLRLPTVLPAQALGRRGRLAWGALALAYLVTDLVRTGVLNHALSYRFAVAALVLGFAACRGMTHLVTSRSPISGADEAAPVLGACPTGITRAGAATLSRRLPLGRLLASAPRRPRPRAVDGHAVRVTRWIAVALIPLLLLTHHSWSEDSWIDTACHVAAFLLVGLAAIGQLLVCVQSVRSHTGAKSGGRLQRFGCIGALGVGFASENLLVLLVVVLCCCFLRPWERGPQSDAAADLSWPRPGPASAARPQTAMSGFRAYGWCVGMALSWPACYVALELLEAAKAHEIVPVLMTFP